MAFVEALQQRVWEWLASAKAQRAARVLIAALALLFLGLFLYAAVKRMQYPFEVEWIESGILVSVLRIAHGQGLYVAPTLNFVYADTGGKPTIAPATKPSSPPPATASPPALTRQKT